MTTEFNQLLPTHPADRPQLWIIGTRDQVNHLINEGSKLDSHCFWGLSQWHCRRSQFDCSAYDAIAMSHSLIAVPYNPIVSI